MMKKFIAISLILAACLALTACTGTSMSYTFNVETGEQIDVKLNTTGGYKFTQSGGDMYVSDPDGDLVLIGYFLLPDAYESFILEPILESGKTNDGNGYLYATDSAGAVVFLARAKDASAGVLFYSGENADVETCRAVFERLSFKLQ